jgi:hypothetical protein
LGKSAADDHLVGENGQRWRHLYAKRPGGFQVDDELELVRLHDRQHPVRTAMLK